MNAEILRRAANLMRDDRDGRWSAVADSLDLAYEQGEDDDHEVYYANAGGGYAGECHDECPACARFDRALTVARDYLGEPVT